MSYLPRTLPRTNLYCWLDATGLVNNTTNAYGICSGGTCSQWSDLSGNGRHFTQGTGANQPTLGTGLSSRTTLTFDGGDYLNNATAADWKFMHNADYTVIALVKFGIIANPNVVYHWMGNGATSSANVGFLARYADRAASLESDAFEWYVWNGGGVSQMNSVASFQDVITANAYGLVAIRVTCSGGATSRMFNFLTNYHGDGTTNALGSASAANATYNIQVGAGGNNSSPLVGGIQEIAIYNAMLSIGTYSKALAYFQAKYAL